MASAHPLPEDWRAWPLQARLALLEQLLERRWDRASRVDQRPPEGTWSVWVYLAGRGAGKTRSHGEWTKRKAKSIPWCRGGLIARTKDDVRDTMVEGESGLLSIMPPSLLRGGSVSTSWNRSLCELHLSNGGKLKGFSSEVPSALRGPQHHFLWCDEAAAWADADKPPDAESTTWSNAMLGLRLGQDPRCVVSTTPKPVGLLRGVRIGETRKPGILEQDGTVITRATTYDNLANLSPTFRANVLTLYEGSRIGRQELLAEVLEDVEGALWTLAQLESLRVHEAPPLLRVVVSVDPAVSNTEDSDETGIVVAGLSPEGSGYVLGDFSGKYDPHEWADKALWCFDTYQGDLVVGEVNNGGDLVETNIRASRRRVPFKKVSASRGKMIRAEPISTLYEQRAIHHVGTWPALEDQMTTWVPGMSTWSPDRMDAMVWAFTELMGGKAARRLRHRRQEEMVA